MWVQDCSKTIGNLAGNERGNVSVVAAFTMLPVLAIGGAALDYQRASHAKLDLQTALDTAIMSQAAVTGAGLDKAKMNDYFAANLVADDYVSAVPEFSIDAGGIITGSVKAKLKASFLTVVGIDSLNVVATSKAQQAQSARLATATFKITNAQGAYDKNIYFFTVDKDRKKKMDKVLQYNYSYSAGRGSKSFTPITTSSITINVDEYASWGIAMEVFEDLSYTGKHINPVMHYSTDEDAADWT